MVTCSCPYFNCSSQLASFAPTAIKAITTALAPPPPSIHATTCTNPYVVVGTQAVSLTRMVCKSVSSVLNFALLQFHDPGEQSYSAGECFTRWSSTAVQRAPTGTVAERAQYGERMETTNQQFHHIFMQLSSKKFTRGRPTCSDVLDRGTTTGEQWSPSRAEPGGYHDIILGGKECTK